MKLKNIIWKATVALMALPCCTACSDEESTVIEPIYYIGTEIDPSDSYSMSVMVNKTDNVVTANVQAKYNFVVRSTLPVVQDVQINAEPDETLVKTYNDAHGTSYVLLPAVNYQLSKQVVIKAGAYASTDSISVVLADSKTLTNENGYLLPIRLASSKGGSNGTISTNRSIVYLKVDVSLTYPGNMTLHGTEPLIGATNISRTEWGIECAAIPYNNTFSINYLIDDNYGSAFFCSIGSATPITLDMKTMHTPKGVSIASGYGQFSYSSYALNNFQLSVSKDGKKWISYGEVAMVKPIAGSTAANPFIQYVAFNQLMEARFIQLRPLTAYGNYLNLSEINLYE